MSLFICDTCGCVDNTSCNNPPYDNVGLNPDFPNLHGMEMAGFGSDYEETGIRSPKQLLCSECNTGTWHGEFPKNKATEAEIIMGEQLQGDEKNIFTFHPLWRLYDQDPEEFNIEVLKKMSLEPEPTINAPATYHLKNTFENIDGWMGNVCEPYKRDEPKIGRNDPCPCGSGRKYKKCCSRGNPSKQQ